MSLPPVIRPLGAMRFNSDSQKLEYFNGDTWFQVHTEPASGLGGRAFRAGGGSGGTIIERFQIATGGTAVDTGFDLSVGVHAHAAAGSRTRAVIAGGRSSAGAPWAQKNEIQYFQMASVSNSIDFGDLTATVGRFDGHSNNTRMITGGGQSGNDLMNLIIIPSTGNATDFGNLTTGREGTAACGSPTRALFAGGNHNPGTETSLNIIDYVTISSGGGALDFGDLTNKRYFCSAMSNPVRAAFAQGYVIPSGANATIDYTTIVTKGNAYDFGDALAARYGSGKFSSPTRCGWTGGQTPTTIIQQIDINVKSDSTHFGDLTIAGTYNGGHSDLHGGIV